MELVFVVVIASCMTAIVRYVLPGRGAYGAALMPALGAGLSAAVWVALTWLGMPWDGGWIWVISLVVPLLVAVGLALWLPRHRAAVDEAKFTELVAP